MEFIIKRKNGIAIITWNSIFIIDAGGMQINGFISKTKWLLGLWNVIY